MHPLQQKSGGVEGENDEKEFEFVDPNSVELRPQNKRINEDNKQNKASGGSFPSPTPSTVNKNIDKDESTRKAFLNQMDIPWEKVESRFDPDFMKCDGKIVKYDSKGLAIWRVSFVLPRALSSADCLFVLSLPLFIVISFLHNPLLFPQALVASSYTIISDSGTWYHLNMLTIICFATMAVCYFTDAYKSQSDNNAVVNRIQTLISFVLASYVTIVVNRWDRIRNTTLGKQSLSLSFELR